MLATPELLREASQPGALSSLLPRWAREIPLYRDRRLADFIGSGPPEAWLASLPTITKRDIREGFPANFLRDGLDLDDLIEHELVELEQTSGTSEERTPLLLGRHWWSEQELRALRLNAFVAKVLDGTSARRVTLSSPVCNGDVSYRGVPAVSQRVVGQTLHASLSRQPFLWGEAELARIARETLGWKPQFLDVDPVYGVVFARYCERAGIRLPSLRFILASYEFVSAAHRRVIERAFGVPVFNLYGSTETGHLLMENEAGEMVPSLETAFLEVPETDGRGVGELIVTTLTNEYMPLIRYRIGDVVQRREEPYRTTYVVHGRAMDCIPTGAGRCATVWEVDQIVSGVAGIVHYQLRRGADGVWLLNLVPDAEPPDAKRLSEMRQQLLELLRAGDGVTLATTDALLPESSGKFRLVYPGDAA